MRFLRKITLLLPMLLFSVPMFGCSSREPGVPPNIVVISIDGLRSDYLTPKRMPLLSDFSNDRCRIFQNARANSTWGKPSHATMLTGFLQSEHGVEYDDSAMPIELEMIQEKLQKAGYTTAAFVCGNDLDAESGFDRGFNRFDNVAADLMEGEFGNEAFAQNRRNRMASFDEAGHFLMSHPAQPVFLYIQSNAVSDYWYDAFPLDARISDESKPLREEEESAQAEFPLWENFRKETSTDRKRFLYARAVRELDQRLHEFLQLLQNSPIFPNTKVIITSAHGEGLGDRHGDYISYGHAASPYSDLINVPLVVYGLDKGRTDRLVGLDDIAGTILGFADPEKRPEKSLFRRRGKVVSEYISRTGASKNRAVAIMSADRKFLVSTDSDLHMFTDPIDATDLIRTQYAEINNDDISEELKDQLRALGYLQQ